MKKTNNNEKPQVAPATLDKAALDAIRGGINGGLNRDIIRRKV